jgi:hypothetical protein
MYGLNSSGLVYGPVAGFCKHGNVPSLSINCWAFCLLPKKYPLSANELFFQGQTGSHMPGQSYPSPQRAVTSMEQSKELGERPAAFRFVRHESNMKPDVYFFWVDGHFSFSLASFTVIVLSLPY